MRLAALGGIAAMLAMAGAAIGFGGSPGPPMTRSQAVAALRRDRFVKVSSSPTRYLRCTSQGIDFNAAPWVLPGSIGSPRLPAYRVFFSDARLPGTFSLEIDLLPDAGRASLCARGGVYAELHVQLDELSDSPVLRSWPSRQIDAATFEIWYSGEPGRYYVLLSRGRVLAEGGANTRSQAALLEHDLAEAAAQLSS